MFEMVKEGGWGGREVMEEETLLDALNREHGQVGWGQVYANVLGRCCWMGPDYLCRQATTLEGLGVTLESRQITDVLQPASICRL